jgi:alanine dehydrogenase
MPQAVKVLAAEGHEIRVQRDAGAGIGLTDADYQRAGAEIVSGFDAWSGDLVVKVKEMQDIDFRIAPPGRVIFSFHHLPRQPQRTKALAGRGDTAIAFENVEAQHGYFPLLAPMSVIAGRMAIDIAGKLRGAELGQVLILGAGHAGLSAARVLSRNRIKASLLTRSVETRDAAREQGFVAELATPELIEALALESDVVIGAIFVPGQPTPKLLPASVVKRMKKGSVIIDISIDAGGVAETSRPTTHQKPTFVEHGVIHYCVPNMPAALPSEGASAISVAALPYVRQIAAQGLAAALRENEALRKAVLVWQGQVTHRSLAAEAGLPFTPLTDAALA